EPAPGYRKTMPELTLTTTVLPCAEWQAREFAHSERADALTADHRVRAQRGEKHPIEDFLFTYYPFKPRLLRRWHPGAGVVLTDAAGHDRADWRWYREAPGGIEVDASAFLEAKGASVDFIEKLLRRTAARVSQFGCFGLHEWAMVYRQEEIRHAVPLRLGQA